MDDSILERFERQVEALLKNFDRLKSDNAVLREKQAALLSERSELDVKNQATVRRIESIIDRLKVMEVEDGSTRS